MSVSGSDPANRPSELQEIQKLFVALIEELDRALESSRSSTLGGEDLERIRRAKDSASKGLAAVEKLLRLE